MPQPSFFDNEPLPSAPPPWEQDDQALQQVARVVFPTGLDGAFDYRVPERLLDATEPGVRVIVPLGRGNRTTLGYCIALRERGTGSREREGDGVDVSRSGVEQNSPLAPRRALKSVEEVVDERPLLSAAMLELTRWIADYYLCPLGQVLDCVLPAGVRGGAGTRLTTVLYVNEKADELLAQLGEKGEGRREKKNNRIHPKSPLTSPLSPKQLHVLDTLRRAPEPLTSQELQKAAKCSAAPIQVLKRLGLIRMRTIRRQTELKHESTRIPPQPPHRLNPDQQRTLDTIVAAVRANRHETFLLHGVTGSGKTEVYIRAIDEVVRRGGQAIVLVPEISLTPQTVGRFKGRFAGVAVLHSHLTDAQRHHEWMRIASGDVQVVVGARSAVFAPVPKLGLIVIDEEHEHSFKQDTAPRYHARDVARKRAQNESVPLLLGSATPSLESWHAAETGEYTILSMPRRVRDLVLPLVDIVDLRDEVRARTTRGAIHRQLHTAIRESLEEGGQVILLLNRRGFSTHIQCPACGEALTCPQCSVSLTHHRTEEIALCHYCDYQIPAPNRCPRCGFSGMRYTGFGTQKLEQEIKSRFPNVPCLRMDTDTMHGVGAHERALAGFREGRVRILLGTQMIAKGLDFPNVTLVGVINADTALHLPDFRATERTFHLITQVAGRTGRGEKGGRVIVQTFVPDHAAILAASRHDYRAFVSNEMPMRKTLGYPPYSRMVRIVVRGEDETRTLEFAKALGERLDAEIKKTGIVFRRLGPAPAPFSKLRGLFRFHTQLHAFDGEALRESVRRATAGRNTPDNIQWIADIDPLDML